MYFVDIVSSYNEDVILSAFFNDPNVENAIVRGKKEIELSDNKLKQLLEEFEKVANENRLNKLDKYDVFTSWFQKSIMQVLHIIVLQQEQVME